MTLEQQVVTAAGELARAERRLAEEYLLLVGSGQYHTWQAQKMAEIKHGLDVRLAQAQYEIALARLRK